MALARTDKERVVAEVADLAARAPALVVAEYRGLTVTELTELRRQARADGVQVRVIKNSLARRAFRGTAFDDASQQLLGPLLFGFVQQEAAAGAKVFADFSKEHAALQLKFAVVDGGLLDAGGIAKLASLPSREQALAMLMGVLKAPISKLVRAHADMPGRLVRALAACRGRRRETD